MALFVWLRAIKTISRSNNNLPLIDSNRKKRDPIRSAMLNYLILHILDSAFECNWMFNFFCIDGMVWQGKYIYRLIILWVSLIESWSWLAYSRTHQRLIYWDVTMCLLSPLLIQHWISINLLRFAHVLTEPITNSTLNLNQYTKMCPCAHWAH